MYVINELLHHPLDPAFWSGLASIILIDLVLAGDDGPELFQAYAPVRRVYALSRRMVRHPLATVRVALQIHRAHYDLAIDPCETSQSGRLLLLAAAARHTLATATTRRQRNGPPATPPRHLACVPVFLLRQHLAEAAPAAGAECPPLDLRLTAVERQQGLGALQRALPMPRAAAAALTLGVFCEASGAKRYGPDWWRRFVHGVRTAHPGAALMEIVPADGIARLDLPAFGSPSPRRVAAVIANLTYFVSADCGVMHLACAAGTPTIGLFKASDAAKYGPYGRGSCALLTAGKTAEEVAEDVAALIRARPEGTRCKLPAAPAAHAIASRSSTAHAS